MPEFLSRFFPSQRSTAPVNRFEGFTGDGRVVLRDRRNTRKAEIPNVSLKSETLGDDPPAIYTRRRISRLKRRPNARLSDLIGAVLRARPASRASMTESGQLTAPSCGLVRQLVSGAKSA
jgi:hypothetical protein